MSEKKKYNYPNTYTLRGFNGKLRVKAEKQSKKEGYKAVSRWLLDLVEKAVK